MKISRRETILIVVIIFAITGAAYYIYYLVPTLDEIEKVNMSIEQKQLKLISMQAAIDQIPNIQSQIEELEKEIDIKSENIPVGISQPLQLVAITNVMNEKCDSLLISFGQGAETYEDYQKSTVDLTFSTSYENLEYILEQFAALDMTNQIVNTNLTYTEDTLTYYTALLEGYYISVGTTVEFYSFYADPDAEPIGKQPFEISPIEGKNPFKPTLN